MEGLAWKPDQLLRVSRVLAKLAERKITDNWVNKPDNSHDNFDYQKREESVRKARVDALQEIWTEKGFVGIQALAATSGTPMTIGWHLADGVIDEAGSAEFLPRWKHDGLAPRFRFKRNDDGEDPPEWRIQNAAQREAVWSAAYTLLEKIRRIPGTADDGTIKATDLKAWVTEARSLCLEHGRVEIGDQKIGQILAAAPVGDDGIWPCGPVREVLEDVASPEIAI
jgi:hypothetical protein